MTDRELLERAAKAAGMNVKHSPPTAPFELDGFYIVEDDEAMAWWNPLTSDGDALRLAVKLNLRVVFHPALNQAIVREYHATPRDREWCEDGEKHTDPCAATRRAIVRAAAALAGDAA